MRAELTDLQAQIAASSASHDGLLDRRARLYLEMVGAGLSKAEIARTAGVTAQAITFALERLGTIRTTLSQEDNANGPPETPRRSGP